MTDPVAAADAVVAAVDPGLSSPGVESRDVVLVTGPWLAGTTSLIAALRERMPEHTFVEADELGPADAPAAVVFVVSAIAPLTESDCALVDLAANYTDLVIGVVAKIDAHRNWRDVLAADRARLAARAPRYQHVQWVGAAAAPDLGEPRLDELVGLLRQRLADPDVQRRNRLRAWEVRLHTVIDRYQADAAGADRQARVTALRKNRDDILRGRRLSKSERTIALRSQIQQARVQLTYFARNRCTSVRAELQEDASNMSRRRLGEFESYVRTRVGRGRRRGGRGHHRHTSATSRPNLACRRPRRHRRWRPPEVAQPPLKSRRLETQLMMIARRRLRVRRRARSDPAVRGPRPGSDHRGPDRRRSGGPAAHGVGGGHPGAAARSRGAGPLGHRRHRHAALRGRGTGGHPGAGRRNGAHHRPGRPRRGRERHGRRSRCRDRRRTA